MKSKKIIGITMISIYIVCGVSTNSLIYENNVNWQSNLHQSGQVDESKVIQAVRDKLKNSKIKVYGINDWTKIDNVAIELKILPAFLKVIDNNGLNLNGEDLVYDINEFKISKIVRVTNDYLDIIAKYSYREFSTTLIFDNNYNDDDISKSIQSMFNSSSKNILELTNFDNNSKKILNRAEEWLKNQLNTIQFFINNLSFKIDINKFNIFAIDMTNFETAKELSIMFEYGNSYIYEITILVKYKISKELLQNAIQDIINNNLVLLLPKTIDYKNFVTSAPFEKWIKDIRMLIGTKIEINNTKVDFLPQNLMWDNEKIKVIELNHWTKTINLPLIYNYDGEDINLVIDVNLRSEINYEDLTNAFLKQLNDQNFFISGIDFIDKSTNSINNIILQQIKEVFKTGIHINTKKYELDINAFKLKDFKIIYDNEFKINLQIQHNQISLDVINVSVILKNYYLENLFNVMDCQHLLVHFLYRHLFSELNWC